MARRQHLTLTVVVLLMVFFSITYLFSGPATTRVQDGGKEYLHKDEAIVPMKMEHEGDFNVDLDALPVILEGESIAPKLENATLK